MDIQIKNKIKINRNTLFIIGYLIFFIQFWTKGLLKINEYIFYFPAAIFIIASIDIKNLTPRDILAIACLNLLGLISYVYSGTMTILKTTFILSAIKNKDIDKIIKCTFWASAGILLGHIICSSILHIGDLYKEVDFGRGVIERRYYFGFSHTNTAQSLFNTMMLCWLYSYLQQEKEKKWRIIGFVLVIALTIVMYELTKSRTGLVIALVFILFSMLDSIKKYQIMRNYKLTSAVYVAAVLGTILFVYCLNGTAIFKKLNQFTTRRLEFSRLYTEEYPITPFGQEISNTFETAVEDVENKVAFDQGIINSLLTFGLLINLLFYFTQLKLLKKYSQTGNTKRIMIICVMIIYAITEDILFYPFVNFGLLFIGDLLYENEGEEIGRKDSDISTNV